jgi:hypothetical protein
MLWVVDGYFQADRLHGYMHGTRGRLNALPHMRIMRKPDLIDGASVQIGGRAKGATPESVHDRFTETLSRARPKELAHDYLERETKADSPLVADLVVQQWQKER